MSSFKLNPKHKGWCTPMTKKTCTGKRKQFAINAKNHFKKHAAGGTVEETNDPTYNSLSNILMLRNKDKNFVQRAYDYQTAPVIHNPDGSYSSHLMAWDGNLDGTASVYPTIIQNSDGSLSKLPEDKAWDYAHDNNQLIQTPSYKMAEYLSNRGYKNVTGAGSIKKASGGRVNSVVPTEVEGDEVAQLPMGQVIGFDGPSHEDGGIPVALPENTEVFSDRISIDGKTMADRKLARERKLNKLGNLINEDPTNKVIRGTAKRTSASLAQEEVMDKHIQDMAKPVINKHMNKMAGGGRVKLRLPQTTPTGDEALGVSNTPPFDFGDWMYNHYGMKGMSPQEGASLVDMNIPTGDSNVAVLNGGADALNTQLKNSTAKSTASTDLPNSTSGNTLGNIIGLVGTGINSIAPLLTTLAQRRSDTPNINPYLSFGKNALETNSQEGDYLNVAKQASLANAKIAANTSKANNRNSAQGIGTQRALNAVSDMQQGVQENNIMGQYSNEMMSLLNQKSALENQQDSVVMGGEAQRDRADRADKDAFYSSLNRDFGNLGTGLQYGAKNLNEIQQSDDEASLIGELSKYGLGYTRTRGGKLKLTKVKR